MLLFSTDTPRLANITCMIIFKQLKQEQCRAAV